MLLHVCAVSKLVVDDLGAEDGRLWLLLGVDLDDILELL